MAEPRSREEDEELQRSTKKVKESHRACNTPAGTPLSPEGNRMSYKERLTGEIPGAYEEAFSFEASMDTEVESDDESSDLAAGIVAVNLSGVKKVRMRAQWTNALIVKVVGKTVGFHFLLSRIMSLWKPSGRMDCVDLEKDFFLIRFSLKKDYERVLKDGPWFVEGHHLSIRNWEPNFRPSMANVSAVVVWVRLPKLPIEYYEPSVLRELGQAIGPVLRVDTHTAAETRGHFARICVQINFEKPLIKLIRIGGIEQPVLYEGINSLCFSCGRVGHKAEGCPYSMRAPETRGNTNDEAKVDGDSTPAPDCKESSRETYGPWVLVSRKKKVANKEIKGSAQHPHFSTAHQSRARFPDKAESPVSSRLDPSGPKDQRALQNTSLFSAPSASVANRTNQAKVNDKTKVPTIQLTPKHLYRYSQAQQKVRGAIGLKSYRQKHSFEGKAEAHVPVFNLKLNEPIVFSAGSSMKPISDTSSDMATLVHVSDAQGVESSGVIKEDPLSDISNDQIILEGAMEDRVAVATHNVSTVILKRIDPKLRPPKMNAEAKTSPRTFQGEDIMIQANLSKELTQGALEMDPDGMQMEDGGEPSVSD